MKCMREGEVEEGVEGACVSCCCMCVCTVRVCASIWTPFMPAESLLNRRCMFQSSSLSFITLLLQCMSYSLYLASLFLHMCLSLSLSPSAAPQGRLLNAAICLCLPSLPSLPPSVAFSLSLSPRLAAHESQLKLLHVKEGNP